MNTSPAKSGLFIAQTMKHTDTSETPASNTVHASVEPEWVLASKYEELTGVTPMAVHQRRKEGKWLDGKHCAVIARRLYVNIKEADQWIKSQASKPQRAF